MTEAEWLTATDICSLLHAVRDRTGERKYRLFTVAFSRHLFPNVTHTDLCRGIELAEQMADGTACQADLERAREYFNSMSCVRDFHDRGIVGENMFLASIVGESLRRLAQRSRVLAYISDYVADGPGEPQCGPLELRDIFGNPFRPVVVDPCWQSETVVALANAIYAERAFDRMPILADALEEAGCDHADILAHCRSDGPHVRGCWVVDLVLGKS